MSKIRSLAGIAYNKLFYSMYDLRENDKRILHMKDKYAGKRCFLLGSGPSMKGVDLSLLDNEIKVGLNMIYKTGIKTDLYFIVGHRIPERYLEELLNIDTTLFLGSSAGRWLLAKNIKDKSPIILKEYGEINVWKDISLDIKGGVRGGLGVSMVALQVLLYLGFDEVYLLGHDCDYNTGNQHFYDPSLNEVNVAKDLKIYERDWSRIFSNYSIINEAYIRRFKQIFNSTPGGKLEVFERISLGEVLKWKR